MPKLIGTPILYDSPSELIGGKFVERLLPGCFDEWLQGKPDIIACVNHHPEQLLGRTKAGTLKLRPTSEGITVEIDQPDTTYANDLATSIRRGDITGMSFVFSVDRDHWPARGEREVEKGRLYEVSFVVFPAYPATTAGMRHRHSRRRHMQLRLAAAELSRSQRMVWRHDGIVTEVSGDEADLLRVRRLYNQQLAGGRRMVVVRADVRAL